MVRTYKLTELILDLEVSMKKILLIIIVTMLLLSCAEKSANNNSDEMILNGEPIELGGDKNETDS